MKRSKSPNIVAKTQQNDSFKRKKSQTPLGSYLDTDDKQPTGRKSPL